MRPLFFGFLGSISLVVFYFLVMGLLSRSLVATLVQFRELWFWMISLSIGFGIQVGLYVRFTEMLRARARSARVTVLASGSVSSVSVVVCCAHHFVDVLPLLGFSALSIFLVRYQIFLLAFSLLVNFLGIAVMIRHLKEMSVRLDLARDREGGDGK